MLRTNGAEGGKCAYGGNGTDGGQCEKGVDSAENAKGEKCEQYAKVAKVEKGAKGEHSARGTFLFQTNLAHSMKRVQT